MSGCARGSLCDGIKDHSSPVREVVDLAQQYEIEKSN